MADPLRVQDLYIMRGGPSVVGCCTLIKGEYLGGSNDSQPLRIGYVSLMLFGWISINFEVVLYILIIIVTMKIDLLCSVHISDS